MCCTPQQFHKPKFSVEVMNKTEAIKTTSNFGVWNLYAVWRNADHLWNYFIFFKVKISRPIHLESECADPYASRKGTVLLQWRNNSSQIETVKTETVLPFSCCSHINTGTCFVDRFWKSQ